MKKRLGKGLDALFEDDGSLTEREEIIEIDIDKILVENDQPRKIFNEQDILDLAQSIKNYGLINPITVRQSDNGYVLIAGERRLRACKTLNMQKVPCIVRRKNDYVEVALIENLQRKDLNPYEEALAFKKLIDLYGWTQEELSKRLGISRPKIANSLRILNIGKEIIDMLIEGKLTEGHAKVLLSIQDENERLRLAKVTSEKNLSVRELEDLIKSNKMDKKEDIVLKEIEENLMKLFGLKVKIKRKNKKGKVEIEFSSDDDLEKIISLLMP